MRKPYSIHISYLIRALVVISGALPWMFIAINHDTLDMRPLFKAFCHQIPERTLTFFGTSMVVCSRCAGIYAGIAIGAIIPSPRFMAHHWRKAIWAAFIFVMLDVIVQNYLLHSANHISRITTGFFAGWMASAFLFYELVACNIATHKSTECQES